MAKIRKYQQTCNSQTMIVAIDIGKAKNCVRFRDLDGNDSRPYEFSNSRAGFDKFHSLIQWHKIKYDAKHVVVGFESTGGYGVPLAHFLAKHNIKTFLINPCHTKRLKELYDNSPNKTDEKDPGVIADIIQLGRTLTIIIPKGVAADLRALVHTRERANSMIKIYRNQMQEIVFQVFPEFHYHIKNHLSKTALYLLQHYPLPDQLTELTIEELSALVKKKSRGKYSSEKASQLLNAAQNTVGIKEGTSVFALEIGKLIQSIIDIQDYISDLEKQIHKHLQKVPFSRSIMSIRGIGKVTTAIIIGETGGFDGFTHAKEIEKLAGLNLYEISSGKHKGQLRISKRGRSLLRKAFYFAAINVVREHGVYHDKYQTYLERGMPKKKALISISRKLVRVIFAIAQKNTEFDVNYEQKKSHKEAA